MLPKSPYILLAAVAALLTLGIIMLFSAGAYALDSQGDPYHFVTRQTLWLTLGLAAATTCALLDYHIWQKIHLPLLALAILLLILCFVPHIGDKINGESRWIRLGPLTFQPSELGRLAVIVFLAHTFSRDPRHLADLRHGFLEPVGFSSIVLLLILFEVDLGSASLIGATAFVIMFVAGMRFRYLLLLAASAASALALMVLAMPDRIRRLLAFLHPEEYLLDEYYQQWMAWTALDSGSAWGLGIGNSQMKLHTRLPFAHTDFIFAIVGEELGLRTTLLVVFAFLLLLLAGYAIALHARDRFGMLLGLGLTTALSLQAIINLGVVTSLLPNKGMPLPFISYGGSNLLLSLVAIGILVSIYRHGVQIPTPRPQKRKLDV